MSDPYSIHDDYTAALKLLKSIANEIDEHYLGQLHAGEVLEMFGPFTAFGGDPVDQAHIGYPVKVSWPNLKCLRDDIRKLLED